MRVTLEQITERQDRLELEIVEREAVLAAVNVLRNFVKTRPRTKSFELGRLAAVLAPAMLDLPPIELADAEALRSAWSVKSLELGSHLSALPLPEPTSATEAVPAPPTAPTPEPPYIHPELQAFPSWDRNNGKYVSWAIKRMTGDYTLRDIAAQLKREGYPLSADKISVVLSRLKSRGEIEEVSRGRGRRAAVFRKPADATPAEERTTD